MRKHIGAIVLAILVIGALLIYTITYQVDELKDIVLIETFGKVTRTLKGRDDQDAGLHLKWPWPVQRVVRYDSRTFVFEDTHEAVSTNDQQEMLVCVYCIWRIDDPERFHRAVRNDDPVEKAAQIQEEGLRTIVRSAKNTVVGKTNIAAFINTNPEEMQLEKIEQAILEQSRAKALGDYGVGIVRIGIRSLSLPETVTKAVIEAMKEERQRDVSRYEQQGESQAKAIEARAESARNIILAFARRKAKEIRTQGDRAAAEYYVQFREDPDLAVFLRRLESLEKIFADKATIVMDPNDFPVVKMLRDGPTASPGSGRAAPGSGEANPGGSTQ